MICFPQQTITESHNYFTHSEDGSPPLTINAETYHIYIAFQDYEEFDKLQSIPLSSLQHLQHYTSIIPTQYILREIRMNLHD